MKWNRAMASGIALLFAGTLYAQQAKPIKVAPSKMSKLGTVSSRFLSYNIEMEEVTGGPFWKPYKSFGKISSAGQTAKHTAKHGPLGRMNLYQYRPPINLGNPRLRKLAEALSPAYLRVSGTWANSTYFQDNDAPRLKTPPKGFKGVLTRSEWKGVVNFSRAVGVRIVTSVAISPGTRNAKGVWTSSQAEKLFDYTRSIGGSIAASAFMNEPTFPGPGDAPAGYDAADFARDVKIFKPFLHKEWPHAVFLGPGGVGEGVSLVPAAMKMKMKMLGTKDLMQATGPEFDAFSYHFYGTVSRRCGGHLTVDQALSNEWLNRTDKAEAFYANLRNTYLPGKPMWLTETAESACGGDELASQFVDTFRFVNQLGTLAQKGVQVVMHNTLSASDYGLLSENTYQPRPDYWAAVLWKRTMGTTVLDPHVPDHPHVRVYAQCMRGRKGGVSLVAFNTDMHGEHTLEIPGNGESYVLTAPSLASREVMLNGIELKAKPDGSLPAMKGKRFKAGMLRLPPASIAFVTVPSANNENCR